MEKVELADNIKRYHKDGFFVIKGVLPIEDVKSIRKANEECIKTKEVV